jgi:hypothetical protein
MAFIKLNKPRGYKPRYIYHDPDKEMHEEIVAQAKRDLGIKDETTRKYAPDIKGKFRSEGDKKITFNFRRSEAKKSNIRIISLLAVLFFLIYFFMLK